MLISKSAPRMSQRHSLIYSLCQLYNIPLGRHTFQPKDIPKRVSQLTPAGREQRTSQRLSPNKEKRRLARPSCPTMPIETALGQTIPKHRALNGCIHYFNRSLDPANLSFFLFLLKYSFFFHIRCSRLSSLLHYRSLPTVKALQIYQTIRSSRMCALPTMMDLPAVSNDQQMQDIFRLAGQPDGAVCQQANADGSGFIFVNGTYHLVSAE